MATVNQEFPSAPPGGRIRSAVVVAAIAAAIGTAAALFAVVHAPNRTRATLNPLTILGPLAVPIVILLVSVYQRSAVERIRIEDNCLVWGKKRHSLEGLTGMERDPRILSWAFRRGGNSGLGAIRGRFWSKRVGRFEAFMTDPAKAVVLRWPDLTLAVSPADPDFFMYSVRSASGFK
jgi:hypothetical protein